MRKVIFCDCDGVLCTARSAKVYGLRNGIWFGWDPLAARAIAIACEQGPKIVVTSTWRKPQHRHDLFEQLVRHGLYHHLYCDPETADDWRTPIVEGSERHYEVKAWLDTHPEVNSYRILDDVDEFHKPLVEKLILTDTEEGMTAQNIQRLFFWADVKPMEHQRSE